MLQKLIIWLVLLPMPLNGLWIVCDDAREVTSAEKGSAQESDASANCARICAMKHLANEGAVCIMLPGDGKASITVIHFGTAILTAAPELQKALATADRFVMELRSSYANPSLSNLTPPPRA